MFGYGGKDKYKTGMTSMCRAGRSTALFVMGREKAAEYWRQAGDFDFILLDADNNLWMTDGAKESFQLAKGFDFTINLIE